MPVDIACSGSCISVGAGGYMTTGSYQATGRSAGAPFTLKLHRGDGMLLLAMNWKGGRPPADFVGFAIQYREPDGTRFFDLKNRLGFLNADGKVDRTRLSTMQSPIQKFRWVHFPRNADLAGLFTYRVTPVFMNARDELSYGIAQEAAIALSRETYPDQLNVAFTRGFVSSQAFVDRYEAAGAISTLLPPAAAQGLTFVPTHPEAAAALDWMGFESRREILKLLDDARADGAQVRVVAYDLSEIEVITRLEALGKRLKIIIDDDGEHGEPHSGETQAAARLAASAGASHVKRQHMGNLQHNKMIIVDGPTVKKAVGGSTNFSWRGLYVQANNAVIVQGAPALRPFAAAFDAYWASDDPDDFAASPSAEWQDLGLAGIDAKVSFSPHSASNAMLGAIAADVDAARTSLFYSLAFFSQTQGPIRDAVTNATARADLFVYGIADRKVGGIELRKPDGNLVPVRPSALARNVPEPFASEPTGGGGTRMHHKFVVLDFDTPDARVYLGSYNFSRPADRQNGENLFLFRDRRIATSYMVEAVRLFDHYHFRVVQEEARQGKRVLALQRPPRAPGDTLWFDGDYSDARKVRDRELFA